MTIGTKVDVVSRLCLIVNFDIYKKLKQAELSLIEQGISKTISVFSSMMDVIVGKIN